MSIVEKALHKAQQAAKAGSAAEPGSTEAGTMEPATRSPPVPDPFTTPIARHSARGSDDSSLTSRDLKQILHFDTARLAADGRLPSAAMARQTEDEIRRIKWPLLKAIAGHEGAAPTRNNVILVTSAVPNEGKTFMSLNLALSIVRDREMRVILVDGDVARPGLTPTLGLEGRPGLNDVLDDASLDVSEVTYRTDVEGLFFIPAGKWHEHSPEFFAGSRMPQIFEAMSRRVGNGVIILDSPPLLATNEAQAATRFVGQVLLVVRADDTEQQAVQDAIALVDKSTPINAVLNRVQASAMSRYYGQYYYGYGYGRGQRPGKGNA
jgi:exopolysaccharide/PEP-CTERM locus tyrosine autokinase